jgi:hypothetical protein
MTKITQFNIKIPETLRSQLKAAAEARGVKMTTLVIQGIRQVLGINANSSEFGVNLDIHQVIDKINLRLDSLEQSQVDIATRLYQYIPELEQKLKEVEENSSISNVAENVYAQIKAGLETDLNQIVAQSIASKVPEQLEKESPQEFETFHLEHEVKLDLTESNSTESPSNSSLENLQITIPGIESNEKGKLQNAQKINSVELLQILKEQDSSGNWNNEKLTNYRRYKRFKDKWNVVGSCQFKYANEISEEKVVGTSKHLHLWWLTKT